jgi:arsenate reductase (thioredoxin)
VSHVLFVCVHNSGRSQMAEAFANRLSEGRVTAESAGTLPVDDLNPTVVQVMREVGYNMLDHHPKVMTPEMVNRAEKIITMGCDVDAGVCPATFVPTEDWGLEDPKGKSLDKVREIRDEIHRRVEIMVDDT